METNKTTTKIKVKFLSTRAKVSYRIQSCEIPEFAPELITEILGTKLPYPVQVSVDQKIMEYLDEIRYGKTFLENNDDASLVIDYDLYRPGKRISEKRVVTEWANENITIPQMRDDFFAMYTKMREEMKGMKTYRKIALVMTSLTQSYTAATQAYRHVGNMFAPDKPKKICDGK